MQPDDRAGPVDPAPGPEAEPEPSGLDERLRTLEPGSVPVDLLSRCLNTIPEADQPRGRGLARRSVWNTRIAAAAAAVLLMGVVGILARPRTATAAHFLQAARARWTEIPACHRVVIMKDPEFSFKSESWYVRGQGGREEFRSGDSLTGVVVNNGRWEFRWDVPGRFVAAWSTAVLGSHSEFSRAGLIQESEALVRWAEEHRADIKVESDTLDGRALRKVRLTWPGPGGPSAVPQVDTVWFDPNTLRPVRQVSVLEGGRITEARLDYPAPESISADLIDFKPPRDTTLEINDPDLGRQVYSESSRGSRTLESNEFKGIGR